MTASEKASWLLRTAWRSLSVACILFAIRAVGFLAGWTREAERAVSFSESPIITLAPVGAVIFLGVALLLCASAWAVRNRMRRAIKTRGRPAEAEILRVEDRTTPVWLTPNICFTLRVEPPDAEPFVAKAETLVSRLDAIRMQPGITVGVTYLPKSHEVVVVGD